MPKRSVNDACSLLPAHQLSYGEGVTFEISERLELASTLPSSVYLSDNDSRVFDRSWQLLGAADRLREPGDFFRTEAGREPVVVLRDESGRLRAYVNVCRHRAGCVVRKSEGKLKEMRCSYHAWTYGLDGRLRATPEFEGVESFNKDTVGLPELQVREWGPLVFGALAPQMSFEDWLGVIPSETEHLKLEGMRPFARRVYPVEANWKTYVDNYLEGYHIPSVHPALFKELDYGRYRTETREWHSLQHAPARRSAKLYAQGATETSLPEAFYYWAFPNLMLNIYQGMLQTNVVIPRGADRCDVVFEWFGTGGENSDELMRFSDEVQAEDAQICAEVQRGLGSSTYSKGRFSVKRENGVHHFHRLWARCMDGDCL